MTPEQLSAEVSVSQGSKRWSYSPGNLSGHGSPGYFTALFVYFYLLRVEIAHWKYAQLSQALCSS